MTSNLLIRPMTLADVEDVMAIAAGLDSAPHWPPAAYQSALDPSAVPTRIALVAASGAEIRGYVVASIIPPEAELESIAVPHTQQRKGIARHLFEALRDELQRREVTLVLLEVRASNLPARALYRALGFEEIGQRTRYYTAPCEDAVLFRQFLTKTPPALKPIDSRP